VDMNLHRFAEKWESLPMKDTEA